MSIKTVSSVACVLGATLFNTAFADAPDVTGLRFLEYSKTAAELFWDRVPNKQLTYEVLRDDGESGLTDGTSFYDDDRSAGVTNAYSVTAITEEGERSEPASIIIGPFDQTNLQVQNLRGDVYSNTTAEIFWLRVPKRDLSYEVMRDDGVTVVTRGNSFYDSDRTAGVTNTYTVTTIDEDGIRALSATLTLAPFGTESIDSPPATGLRATVYSSTSAEVFWDRLPNRALRYEILRDDGLSNITDGTSYYDNKRFPGASNTYLITTIDEEGNRSSEVSIDVPAQ